MSETPSPIPVKVTPAEGLIALVEGLRDGSFSRDDFIDVGDAAIDTGAFETLERAAWGAAHDLLAPLVRRIDIGKIRLFERRTPAELRRDAVEAERAGDDKKASRLLKRAARRERNQAEG